MAVQNNPKTSDYTIRIATSEDRVEIEKFLNKFLLTAEPLNEAANLAKNKVPEFSEFPMPYLPEGLSLMAVAPSGEIVGVALNAELKPNENIYGLSDTDPILKLIYHFENKITELNEQTGNNGKEMEISILSVHENWRNKGIGKKLLEDSKELAQKKGFKQLRVICSSAYTIKMANKCGFESIYSLDFKECQKMGLAEYLPQAPHTHVEGMILKF